MAKSELRDMSFSFAVRIVRLSQYLQTERKEFVLSKQVLRSGTSVGALIREAEFAQSKSDFVHKLSIALKEANETSYWLALLAETQFIEPKLDDSFQADCKSITAMLVTSIKTAKSRLP